MKNLTKLIILIIFLLFITSCNNKTNIQEDFDNLCISHNIEDIINSNIEYDNVLFDNKLGNINIIYESSDNNVLSINNIDNNKILLIPNKTFKDQNIILSVYYNLDYNNNTYSYEKYIPVTINKYSDIELIEMVEEQIELPKIIDNNIYLPTSFGFNVSGTWESSNTEILTNFGIYNVPDNTENINLKLTLSLNDTNKEYNYSLKTSYYSNIDRLNECLNNIVINNIIYDDLQLNDTTDYNINVTWLSSDEKILTNQGVIKQYDKDVILKLILERKNERVEKEFMITTKDKTNININKAHQIIYRIDDFKDNSNNYYNIIKNNDYLELDNNQTEGYYLSDEIDTLEYKQTIGSFAGETSENATIELMISCYVNNTWSEYASYNPWGLNYNYNHTSEMNDGLIKMDEDTIFLLNNKYATKIRFKVILRRNNPTTSSPKLKLVTLCLWFKTGYTYEVNTKELPNEVKYDVPGLYQGEVPSIGGVICSATSSCMLLKYLGHNFKNKDTYEHRYIAGLVYDKGAKIYGNWVFNCNTIAAFGHIAYTGIFYNLEELMYHLAYVGPVALSVRGTLVSEYKTWTTNGHLIVCTGYVKDTTTGKIKFYINDPNVSQLKCTYTYENILNAWPSQVAYIIEK